MFNCIRIVLKAFDVSLQLLVFSLQRTQLKIQTLSVLSLLLIDG